MGSEQELHVAILKITMTIKDKYPELSKYMEKMSVTIPDVKNPEITCKNLSAYYESLKSMLDEYITQSIKEHPKI